MEEYFSIKYSDGTEGEKRNSVKFNEQGVSIGIRTRHLMNANQASDHSAADDVWEIPSVASLEESHSTRAKIINTFTKKKGVEN